ncbi:pyridoxal-dependent decarboxylase [Melampsora americana]|nr:pyridoxal-dependent decarboxylase [Melampsora americana]
MPLAHIRTSPSSQELKSYTAIPSTTSKSEQNNSGEMENILESSLEETSEDETLGRAEKTVKSVRDGHEKLIKEGDHLSNLWSDSADVIPPKRLPVVHSGSIIDTFRTALKSIDLNECEANGENAFYVCDLATVYRLYLRWQKTMGGRVKPFFAVKCNPDPHILNLFAKLGLGFDCASHAEIAQVLAMGVSPSDIIYANPCKAGSFIRYAHASGVDMMTFDNLDELHKVAKHHPSAKMVMRILIDDRESLCRFGEKFGAPLDNIDLLLDTARKLGVNVIGVAFHVGSGCINPELYKDAVKHAKGVFELASQYGYKFNLLDVGGGFGDNNLEELSKGLLAGLDEHFPTGCGVTVIAEPGRYFVTEAFELATNIIARRQASSTKLVPGAPMTAPTSSEEEDATLYYINDGVYGTFNCIMFDHQVVYPKILTLDGKFYPEGPRQGIETALDRPHTPAVLEDSTPASGTSLSSVSSAIIPSENESNGVSRSTNLELHPCKIFGPSCDSIDLVCPRTHLPTKNLKVGDWLSWPRMGAYTICAASEFNGFKISRVKYTIDARGDAKLEHELRLIIGQ